MPPITVIQNWKASRIEQIARISIGKIRAICGLHPVGSRQSERKKFKMSCFSAGCNALKAAIDPVASDPVLE